MVSIQNLSKSYGKFLAVDNLNLEVSAGEIFSFLGVNGAGKTTTLKMLSGVLEPSAGRISIAGFEGLDLLGDQRAVVEGLLRRRLVGEDQFFERLRLPGIACDLFARRIVRGVLLVARAPLRLLRF